MSKNYAIAVDCRLSPAPLESETRLYLKELLLSLQAERPNWSFTFFSDFGAFENFQMTPTANFSDADFDAVWQIDYQNSAATKFGQDIPKIVFVDHIMPLGLKEKIFDTWPEDLRNNFQQSVTALNRDATLVLTSSEWMKRDLVIWSAISPHAVVPIVPGVPNDFVDTVPFVPSGMKKALNLKERYVMCWLDDELFNGFELTFAAFIENQTTFPDCCLLVCYSQPFEILQKVQLWAQQNNRADIIFCPTSDRRLIKELLSDAVCLSHPQFYDGFSLKILSAMSQACPVLTTRSSSFPEVAADTALYTNPGDAIELAKNMHALLHDAGDRSKLKNRTLLRSEKFRWQNAARNVASEIERWLPQAATPVYVEAQLKR